MYKNLSIPYPEEHAEENNEHIPHVQSDQLPNFDHLDLEFSQLSTAAWGYGGHYVSDFALSSSPVPRYQSEPGYQENIGSRYHDTTAQAPVAPAPVAPAPVAPASLSSSSSWVYEPRHHAVPAGQSQAPLDSNTTFHQGSNIRSGRPLVGAPPFGTGPSGPSMPAEPTFPPVLDPNENSHNPTYYFRGQTQERSATVGYPYLFDVSGFHNGTCYKQFPAFGTETGAGTDTFHPPGPQTDYCYPVGAQANFLPAGVNHPDASVINGNNPGDGADQPKTLHNDVSQPYLATTGPTTTGNNKRGRALSFEMCVPTLQILLPMIEKYLC